MSEHKKNSQQGEERDSKVPLIAHVIFRLDTGGLENGLVNLINNTPTGAYRHAIICVTCATEFRSRITASDVTIIQLHKKPGKDPAIYWRFLCAVRKLGPDVIHTRNANTIEFQPLAALAGVRGRIHGEHGWDVHDLDGTSRKYRVLRKLARPFIGRFIVVSKELRDYLMNSILVPRQRISLIYNGVNLNRFRPRESLGEEAESVDASDGDPIVIGTIGRMKEVKNQQLLVQAFIELANQRPELRNRIRLVMAGDGPLRDGLMSDLRDMDLLDLSSFPGTCDDIAELLRGIDIFVLPSRNEGISNTILEAMATGLPVVATRVGGTPEIVQDGITGILTKDEDVAGLTSAISTYIDDFELRRRHGMAARMRVEAGFNLDTMVAHYFEVYRQTLH